MKSRTAKKPLKAESKNKSGTRSRKKKRTIQMKTLNQKATKIFARLLSKMDGQHLKIKNPPYMPLTIEKIGRKEVSGWGMAELYSLCHYYEQNGDLMQDPEMCFLVFGKLGVAGNGNQQLRIIPYMFQQASMGIFEESVTIGETGKAVFKPSMQRDHNDFANQWLTNIEQQGFLGNKTPFYYQLNKNHNPWEEVPFQRREMESYQQAVLLAQRTARRYGLQVKLTESQYPFMNPGKVFSHKDQ